MPFPQAKELLHHDLKIRISHVGFAAREIVTSERAKLPALTVALSATCAVLYAIGSYVTAYMHSPWGAGQFRPAVVIPAVFASLFGPLIGGLGAAVGTLIADSASHGQIYVRSLVSAVPGNFAGFYLFGWLMRKKFSLEKFIKTSQITLLVSNAIVAFLYVYFRVFVEASYPLAFREGWVYISLGLIAWWYVTMLPFVLIFGPPLIRAIASAFPGLVSEEIKTSSMKNESLKRDFCLALIVPGTFMLLIGMLVIFTDPRQLLALGVAPSALILTGMQLMFVFSGVVLLALGLVIYATGRLIGKGK